MTVQHMTPRNSEETREISTSDEGGNLSAVQQSLAVSLARAEVDQQVATARALPRSIQRAVNQITTLATLDEETAAECIYALPRGGKTIRGPSIRFAEIMVACWGNARVGARVVHVARIEQYVEAEGVFHDLETNVAQTARVRRPIQAKRGKGIDNDMIQLAGAAACSIARRNAILAGIPKGVARRGYHAVEDVMRGDIKTLGERRAGAIKAFMVLGVTPDRLFASLGVSGEDDITLDHLLTLNGTRSALKNGETTIEEAFPPIAKPGERPKNLADAIDKLAGEGATVDRETGEVTQGKDYVAASSEGRLNGVVDDKAADAERDIAARKKELDEAEAKGAASSKGTVEAGAAHATASTGAASQAPQDGARQASHGGPSPAPTDNKAALYLADLIETGDGRADGGVAPLREWLDGLDPYDRGLISNEKVNAWIKTAKAKSAR